MSVGIVFTLLLAQGLMGQLGVLGLPVWQAGPHEVDMGIQI